MEIRRATEADLPRLLDLRIRALTDTPSAFGSTVEAERARTPERWRRWIDPGVTFLLGDPAEGLACGFPDPDHPGRTYLVSMWVAPEHRGRRHAEALVESVCEWATQRDDVDVFLHVVIGNTSAERLYERCGFRPTGEIVDMGDGRAERELRRRLRPQKFS